MNSKSGNSSIAVSVLFTVICFSSVESCTQGAREEHKDHVTIDKTNGLDRKHLSDQFVSRQPTIKVGLKEMMDTVSFEGFVIANEKFTTDVSARVSGRIEALKVTYPLRWVNRGDVLLELYSADIRSFTNEYIRAVKDADAAVQNESRKKLLQLGLDSSQLDALKQSRTNPNTIKIKAPRSGYVLPKSDEDHANSWLRQGMFVEEGQALFSINDLRSLWGVVYVSETLAYKISPGMKLSYELKSLPGFVFQSVVEFVEPVFVSGQSKTRIRFAVYRQNKSVIVNSPLMARITIASGSKLIVPTSAVYSLGTRTIVWKRNTTAGQGEPRFTLQYVEVAKWDDANVVILSGLNLGDEIVDKPGLLIDSETVLR